MRGPRLTRSKTSDASLAKANDPQLNGPAAFKTSFDDLRSSDGRQKLREQLSSQFPESYSSSLKSSPSAAEMAGRDFLSVGQNAAAKSSSSSVESTSNGPRRLSAVPEKSNAAVDVEQAINLLTELKKTATPEQLVALHKALLPTRDSIISTADSSAGGQRASVIRQKSMLPAGLATRGGAADDLLRRQEDVEPVVRKKKSKSGRSESHNRLQSKSSIAALDLADDKLSGQRATTPSDQPQFGAYRPGTLRITNGAASPEPGQRPKTSGDGAVNTTMPEPTFASRDRSDSDAKIAIESRPRIQTSLDNPKKRIEAAVTNAAATGPPRAARDPSQSRQYRPQRSREPSQSSTPVARSREPSLTRKPVLRSREPSLSRPPLTVETKASKQSMGASQKASMDSLLRRSLDISRPSMDSIRRSIDDGRVSPIDAPTPRFAQRWSHRASQISQEYVADCDVPISPFEERQSGLTFAQRLSTVYDREDAENTANETPEAALSKLEGNSPNPDEHNNLDETPSSPTTPKGNRKRGSAERQSLRATAAGMNAVRPQPVSYHSEPRPTTKKGDSGYVSDASHKSIHRKSISKDAVVEMSASPVAYEHTQPGFKEIIHRAEPETDDIQSLYTLEQILKMPSLLPSQNATPRPDAGRKHSSLLKLTGLKKSKLAASKTTLEANSSADSLPLAIGSAPSSPADSNAGRPSKKLQKRMPEDIRRQRREQREKEKTSLALVGPNLETGEPLSSPGPESQLGSPSTTTLPSSPLTMRKKSTSAEPLSELVGDSMHPAELDTDESTSAPKRSLSRKQSKKSKRRSRQSTITAADGEEMPEANKRRSFSLGRKRSKSKRRSGSLTPKRRSSQEPGVPSVPSIATLSATWNENGSQESLPLYSDYGSVARTLGTNPYDISTGMFSKGSKSPGPVLDQLQSPHQISTSYSSTGGLRGMNSQMASELARAKSRDVAMQKEEQMHDRPRMATPKRSQTDVPRCRNTMPATPNTIVVEQRSPGWAAKPVFRKNSLDSLESSTLQRSHSVAESIPSLPELPVDAEFRSTKAAEYLAKREGEMQASPILAESLSPSISPNSSVSHQAGFSNESVADAVAKAVEARRAKQAARVKEGQRGERLKPAVRERMQSVASDSTGKVSLQLHGAEEAGASAAVGGAAETNAQEDQPKTAPADDEAPALSVWERQAQLWRDKRGSVGKTLGKHVEEEVVTDGEQTPTRPSTVTTPQPTSSALDSLPSRRRKSASEHANAYRDLIGSDSETFEEPPLPPPHRVSAQSTSNLTSRSSIDTVVVENAQFAKVYQAAPINRERSAGGRVRTPSGSYVPYSPTFATQAERSRSNSFAQTDGEDTRATESLDVQRYHHQQKDTVESILGRYDRTLSPVPASEAGSIMESPERMKRSSHEPNVQSHAFNRYGGGLQYGYERGGGLQGSSGMRSGADAMKSREGNRFSEQFGLDFGDVPVFLRRAR